MNYGITVRIIMIDSWLRQVIIDGVSCPESFTPTNRHHPLCASPTQIRPATGAFLDKTIPEKWLPVNSRSLFFCVSVTSIVFDKALL
jgi:hypothetical protein